MLVNNYCYINVTILYTGITELPISILIEHKYYKINRKKQNHKINESEIMTIELPGYSTLVPNEIFGAPLYSRNGEGFKEVVFLQRFSSPTVEMMAAYLQARKESVRADRCPEDDEVCPAVRNSLDCRLKMVPQYAFDEIGDPKSPTMRSLKNLFAQLESDDSFPHYLRVLYSVVPSEIVDEIEKKNGMDKDRAYFMFSTDQQNIISGMGLRWDLTLDLTNGRLPSDAEEMNLLIACGVKKSDYFILDSINYPYRKAGKIIRALYSCADSEEKVAEIEDATPELLEGITSVAITQLIINDALTQKGVEIMAQKVGRTKKVDRNNLH